MHATRTLVVHAIDQHGARWPVVKVESAIKRTSGRYAAPLFYLSDGRLLTPTERPWEFQVDAETFMLRDGAVDRS